VLLPLSHDAPLPALSANDHALSVQEMLDSAGERFALVATPPVAGRGWLRLSEAGGAPATRNEAPTLSTSALSATLTAEGGAILESTLYHMRLDAQGCIVSLRDKRALAGRELIAAGRVGNHFIAFDDRPLEFDAWDIDEGFASKPYPLEAAQVTITERGPLRATVHVKRSLLGSAIEQDISLYHDLPRIDFATRIEWHGHHLLLKVAFPLDLRTTQARSEIQYGSITRRTHRNTSWDQARFETVAHRWVDLSESEYGVALLNDGRYGHDIHDGVVRLTLLRSPTSPDPDADQGAHEVTFSLLPHLGAWPAGDVIAHGYALNRPLRVVRPSQAPASGATTAATLVTTPQPLFEVDGAPVILEAIKRAAEGDDLIVRLYESTGSRTIANIRCAFPIAQVVETDLLERPLAEGASPAFEQWRASLVASHDAPAAGETGWACQFRPFEIRTFRVTLRRP
jgi:alpha-mannosidase